MVTVFFFLDLLFIPRNSLEQRAHSRITAWEKVNKENRLQLMFWHVFTLGYSVQVIISREVRDEKLLDIRW